MAKQLVLSFPHISEFTRNNTIIANYNFEAFKWLSEWSKLNCFALIIYGERGCGKTHLGEIWRQDQGGYLLEHLPELVGPDVSYLLGQNLLLEDLTEKLVGDGDQAVKEESLLHFLNRHREERGSLLITARTKPQEWRIRLPDLASRLCAMPSVKIHPPGMNVLARVFEKMFRDRGVKVQSGLGRYLSTRIPRRFSEVRQLVDILDIEALRSGKHITIDLARKVLRAADHR